MSLIFEAMQKQKGEPPTIGSQRRHHLGVWIVGLGAVVALSVLVWWQYKTKSDAPSGTIVSKASKHTVVSQPIEDVTTGRQKSLAIVMEQQAKKAQLAPVPEQRMRSNQHKAPKHTTIAPLDWFKQQMPTLNYESHVYSPDRQTAFVVINGKILGIGDVIVPGAKIRQIAVNALVVETPVGLVKLPALRGWQ